MMFVLSSFNFRNNSITEWSNNYYIPLGGSSYNRFREYNPETHYDIIFIGSSRTYRGYNPEVFAEENISSYNLGSSNQTISNSYALVKDLVNSENTSILVVDLYSFALSDISFESSMDLISNIPDDLTAFDIQLKEKDVRTTNNFFRRIFSKKQVPIINEQDAVISGFCKTSKTLDSALINRIDKNDIQNSPIHITKYELNYIYKISELCKKRNIELVFVTSPTSVFFTKKDIQDLNNSILPILNITEDIYLDYSKKLNLDSKNHFFDEGHMNYQGVEIFNKALIKDLKPILNTTQ